jgi:hypothetical protein
VSRKLLTDHVLAKIPEWVSKDRLTPADIASRIGCTVGTLRVQCCHNKISLRRQLLKPERDRPAHVLSLYLSTKLYRRITKRAKVRGLSELMLITALIETIDEDDLYDAVLDDRIEADYDSTSALV